MAATWVLLRPIGRWWLRGLSFRFRQTAVSGRASDLAVLLLVGAALPGSHRLNQLVLSRHSVGTGRRFAELLSRHEECWPMKPVLFVLVTGIVASAVVELIERWRRYRRAAGRPVSRRGE